MSLSLPMSHFHGHENERVCATKANHLIALTSSLSQSYYLGMIDIDSAKAAIASKEALRVESYNRARKEVEKAFARSALPDRSKQYPSFHKAELSIGKFLGKGGFGSVYDVLAFEDGSAHPVRGRKADRDDQVDGDELESRRFIAEHGIRNGGGSRYAIRTLNADVIKDPQRLYLGVLDMAVLTRFLSSIDHAHIIKLRATAKCDVYNANYFMVMDKLYGTLDKRLIKWEKAKKYSSGVLGKFTRTTSRIQDLRQEGLKVAYDVSTALAYLHKRNILFRDCKPENIGFDIDDCVKLFDFGLAKEIYPEDKDKDGLYKLTEMTGSLQYMAPEVAMELPYNASCDVYSFAILLWEVFSLKRPYENYAPSVFSMKIWDGAHRRPILDPSWPEWIQSLLKKSWSKDYIHERYSMQKISEILREECSGSM